MPAVLTMLGLTVVNFGLTMASGYIKNITQVKIDRNMQRSALKKVLSLQVSEIEKGNPREFISRITTDTTLVSSLLLELVIKEIPRLYYMVSAIFLLRDKYDPRLAVTLLATIPILLIGAVIAGNLVFGKADLVQQRTSVLTQKLAEKIVNLPIIKSYNNEAKESADGTRLLGELLTVSKQKAWADKINGFITNFVNFLPRLLTVSVGATLLLRGEITVVSFVAFFQYAQTFINYVSEHVTLWAAVKTAQGATYRLAEIMECAEDSTTGTDEAPNGDIVFRNVSFSYGDKKVLDNVSFTVRAGERTALVGFSGCGKTTTLNLLEQFYQPDDGKITIGGRDIHAWNVKSYRKHFTYVSQNAPAVEGTIRDVLTYGLDANVTDEELYRAIEEANAREMVEKLGGLEYSVGMSADKLSGGQRQKLSIARALLSHTEYMLLDEATSALDTASTMIAQRALNERMRGKTMLMVAHNLKTVEDADKIIVFDRGRILAEGKHSELLINCPMYAALAAAQE